MRPIKGFARFGAALFAILIVFSLGLPVLAQTTPAPPPAPPAPVAASDAVQVARERIESLRSALNSVEGALSVQGLRASDLDDLRTRLDPLRRETQQRIDDLSPRLASAKTRLQELGAPPPASAPPEDPATTAAREQQTAQITLLETAIKQYTALSDRADQVSDQIASRRRALFAEQILDRSNSVLDPALWAAAISAFNVEMRALRYLLIDWYGYASQRHGVSLLSVMTLGAVAVFILVLLGGRKLRQRFRCPPPEEGQTYSRFRAAREAVKGGFFNALVMPLAALAAYGCLTAFDLVPPRAADVLSGAVVACFIYGIGHGIARAVLAPGESWRRLPSISDRGALISFRYYSWTVWTLAIAAFLNILHRTLFAPVALTVATSAVMALLIGGFVARSLIALARSAEDDEASSGTSDVGPTGGMRVLASLRFLIWVVLAGLIIALVTGYISLAAFVSARIVMATGIIGGLYLFNALIDSFFESLRPDTHQARLVSKTLGLKANRLELIGLIVAAVLKLCLLFTAVLLVVGSWTSTTDVIEAVERASFGVRIGNATITLWSVLYALLLLLVGMFVARTFQRWISSKVLPRTDLEPSLQSSIGTVVGYVGTIIAIALAMSEVGLNLENIALVAGALSVGIGFGLQSIVSNFVSGLILLAERPIRVGDTINVKGEEGYVRRISVRATEIETFERSTVIVPNSDLITGMVKNFTHSNTTGRVIVAINATYDVDMDEVRDILVAAACDHPQVIQTPPPRVFLIKFTDGGIVFELRCVVANVDYALTVKSDLHFSILSRFRKAGIGMACQPWAALARAPGDLVPPPPALPAPPPPEEPTLDLPPSPPKDGARA